MLLHFSIYVLNCPDLKDLNTCAFTCMTQFHYQIAELYGEASLTYNNHSIRHLPNFVERFGILDNFSSFPFESFLYQIKKRVKSGSFISSQIENSFEILQNFTCNEMPKVMISTTYPDNMVLIKHKNEIITVLVNNVCENTVSGYKLILKKDLYNFPYPSTSIFSGIYKKSSSYILNVPYFKKCVYFTKNDKYYVIPFANMSYVN